MGPIVDHFPGEDLQEVGGLRSYARVAVQCCFSFRKKIYEDEDPFAITNAIDVMSFTQDIVMVSSEPTTGPPTIDPTKPATIAVKPQTAPAAQPPIPEIPPQPPLVKRQSVVSAPPAYDDFPPMKDYKDPLRELVIISESPSVDDQYAQNCKALANDASTLDHVHEINLAKQTQLRQEEQKQQQQQTLGQLNPFLEAKDVVDPVKEREFLKTLEALEDTDSEAAEKPVLGKISLIRRAKSAVSRTTSRKKKTDQHPLFTIAWDDKNLARTHPEDFGALNTAYEYCAEDLKHDVDEEAKEEEDEGVTVEEVHRRMEQLHHRGRASLERDSNSTESSKKHPHRKRQGMGRGRNNKVSPDTSNESVSGKKDKRMKSAPTGSGVRHRQLMGQEEGGASPPDPLEPWSTRDICNINKLLDTDTQDE